MAKYEEGGAWRRIEEEDRGVAVGWRRGGWRRRRRMVEDKYAEYEEGGGW